MNSVRQILWKVLVVGMIPFILGAGLPRMQCRCAAAKGQLYCECCFRKPSDSSADDASLKSCCRRHLVSQAESPEQYMGPSSDCPTCPQFKNLKTGSCCSFKLLDAPTLTKQVKVSEVNVATLWLPLIVSDWQTPTLTLTAREDAWSRVCCQIPPLDRVIVFERLVI